MSSRRKSCSACARAKRRCDLGWPHCERCLARRVTCVYAWISPQEAQQVGRTTNPNIWTLPEDECYWLDQRSATNAFHLSQDSPGSREQHATDLTTSWPAPMIVSPALVPLIDEITGRGGTTSFLGPNTQLQCLDELYRNTSPDTQMPRRAYNIAIPPGPVQEASGSSYNTHKTFQARAEYAAIRLACQVKALAETGQTSFIHHSQINDSAILRDAFAVCALNAARNPANESLILSEIARRAELLVKATETVISLTAPGSHSTTNLDILPAVQAMLIYQCIRLFLARDISQQTNADLDAQLLARWVGILHEQSQRSCVDPSNGAPVGSSVWKDWVREESIQRTMTFAELLDSIYIFLTYSWYQPSSRMFSLCFTGQVAIWEARSPAEWHQAQAQRPWIELHISSFENDMKAALPEDVDELGIILLACYGGVDALRKWAGNDKRLLEKWGLG